MSETSHARCCLLTVAIGDVYKQMAALTTPLFVNYCNRHNIDFYQINDMHGDNISPAWMRYECEHLLQRYDYVFYCDCDVVIKPNAPHFLSGVSLDGWDILAHPHHIHEPEYWDKPNVGTKAAFLRYCNEAGLSYPDGYQGNPYVCAGCAVYSKGFLKYFNEPRLPQCDAGYMDQDSINYALATGRITYAPLPQGFGIRYNPKTNNRDDHAVHFFGKPEGVERVALMEKYVNKDMTRQRKVVYSVCVGGYDQIKPPLHKEADTQYILFTDAQKPIDGWDCYYFPGRGRRGSRLPKMLAHEYLPEHDLSLYHDACIQLTRPPSELFAMLEPQAIIAACKHPEDNLGRHFTRVRQLGFDSKDSIIIQAHRYEQAGIDLDMPITENTIILRRNNAQTTALNIEWHKAYMEGTSRDQLCLPYALHKTNTQMQFLPFPSRKNKYYTGFHQHVWKQFTNPTQKDMWVNKPNDVKKLTLIVPYYNHTEYAKTQAALWRSYPQAIQDKLNIIVVDDCSAIPFIELGLDLPDNVEVYRRIEDIHWGEKGARNVGAYCATTKHILHTDFDHYFTEADIQRILDADYERDTCYTFDRNNTGNSKGRHYETHLVQRDEYFNAGGLDEDFDGIWGRAAYDLYFHQLERNGITIKDFTGANVTVAIYTKDLLTPFDRDATQADALAAKKRGKQPRPIRDLLRVPWEYQYRQRPIICDPLRPPKVVVAVAAMGNDPLYALTLPTIRAWCAKHGYILEIIDSLGEHASPYWAKFQASQFWGKHNADCIIMLDADILIKPDSPTPCSLHPHSGVWAFDSMALDYMRAKAKSQQRRFLDQYKAATGITLPYTDQYINSGVCVVWRDAMDFFDPPQFEPQVSTSGKELFEDQNLMNARTQGRFHHLPRAYNYGHPNVPGNLTKMQQPDVYFLHLNGASDKVETAKQMLEWDVFNPHKPEPVVVTPINTKHKRYRSQIVRTR